MKQSTKLLSSVVLFSTMLLASCGNGLTNEHQVKGKTEFNTEASKSIGKNTYTNATLNAYYQEDFGSGKSKSNYVKEYTWDTIHLVWVEIPSETETYHLSHATYGGESMEQLFREYKITPTINYYVADNGYRIKGNGTSSNLFGATNSIVEEFIYNSFGYPTKLYKKVSSEEVLSGANVTKWYSYDVSVTYSNK